MAVQTWISMGVYVGGYNLACNAKSFDAPTVTVQELNTTSLCDSWETRIGGLKSAEWSANVMQDFAADQVDQLVGITGLGVSYPISVAPAGQTAGDIAYAFKGTQFQYNPLEAAVGELAMATVSGMGSDSPVVRGALMNPPATAITTTADGAGQQLGAVVAGQSMFAALHVLSASGTSPTLDVVIQSDDNSGFTSPVTRITMAQATGITSEWSSVAGAITDDYLRATLTVGGTTPSFTYALVLGIAAT